MKCPYLIGRRIYFRPLKPEDLKNGYLDWVNDPEMHQLLDSAKRPISEYNLKKYYQQIMESENDVMFAVIEKKTDKHIGNVKLGKIDWIHRHANYGRMIGDKRARGKGYGTEILQMLMEYAFNTLNLNRLYTPVLENNIASIKSNEKAGMVKEGVSKQARLIDGTYVDVVNFAMTHDRYRKLYGQKSKKRS